MQWSLCLQCYFPIFSVVIHLYLSSSCSGHLIKCPFGPEDLVGWSEGGRGSGWENRVLDVTQSSPVISMCLWLFVKINPGAGHVENCCPWVSTKACVRLNWVLCFLTDVGPAKSSEQFGDLWKRSEKGGYKNETVILREASHLLRSLSLEEGNEVSGDSPGWTFWLWEASDSRRSSPAILTKHSRLQQVWTTRA